MSRKKINILVIFGILFLYILSGYLSYASTRDYYTKLTENDIIFSRDRIKSDYLQEIFDGLREDESMQDIVCSIGRIYDVDPSAVAIYDSNYKMLAQSGSCIICDNMDRVIPVEQYLTDEIKEKIADVGGYGLYYCIYRFEYHTDADDGTIIPVSISISSLVNQCDKEITVKLADAEPTNVIDNGDPLYEDVTMSLYLYNSNTNENFNKNCRKAIDNVNNVDLIKEYTKGLGDEFSVGTSAGFHIESLQFPDGKYYYLVTSVVYDADYNTLISADFKNLIVSLTIVYAIAGAVILISANKLYSKNKKLNEARQAFTSAAAHELKTPITIINNQCECLLKNVAPEKKDAYISAIYKQNNRMSHLVTGLLQYNRLSSKAKLNKTDVDLERIIDDELEKYDALIENKKIDVEKSICKDAVIYADRELISLVIDNFLSNAIKYTGKENKMKISIEKNVKKGFKVSVFNSGNGVKAEYSDRIWEILNRSYDEDDHSTGMGLAICKKILELHQYKYGFENKNDGVEFYFLTK